LSEIFSLSREQAEVIYQEVKLPFIGNNTEFNSSRYKVIFSVAKGSREDGLIYFDNGIVFNLANLKARVFFPENSEYKVFKYVYFFDGKKMAYYQDPASNFTQACLALEEKNEFSAIGLSRELIKSLFVKLYFLKGKGLKYFEPFYMDEKEGRYIFRINWANPS
jgi:hypothetical protein